MVFCDRTSVKNNEFDNRLTSKSNFEKSRFSID